MDSEKNSASDQYWFVVLWVVSKSEINSEYSISPRDSTIIKETTNRTITAFANGSLKINLANDGHTKMAATLMFDVL